MFDIGWSELLVIGVVALIVVGPKDLPRMFKTLGEVTGKARRMAREFQSAMNDAAKDSGVNDIAGDLRKMSNPKKFGMDALKDATGDLDAWSPDAADGKPPAKDAGLKPDPLTRVTPPKTGDAAAAQAKAAEAEAAATPDPAAKPKTDTPA